MQLGHEALAEAHDFVVALALGIEIAATFAAAHRQRGERVFEHLLEGQELQNAEVHRGMEAQAAFVRPDGAVHLDTEAAVDLDVALVVKPRHAEHKHALRLYDPLENAGGDVFGMLLQYQA